MLEMLDNWDWPEVFGYAGEETGCNPGYPPSVVAGSTCSGHGFTREDVKSVSHFRVGENDGPMWLICGELRDGRWFYIEAGCDYTGWDCQADGSSWVADSWDDLLQFGLTSTARDAWGL